MIGIRADGNENIGTGHVMRCLSIADALRRKGRCPVFFTVDSPGLIEQAGFECIRLEGVFNDLSGEDISPLLREKGISTLLVDSYFADAAYFGRLRGRVWTAAIYDMGDSRLPLEMLVNYNLDFDSHEYPENQILLLGCKYAPLRLEFQHLNFKRKFDAVKNVMITTGGTDKYNITSQIIRLIRQDASLDGIALHAVIGSMNVFAEEIKKTAEKYPDSVCYENITEMAALMQNCDAVISAGGSTLYEICACGIPCIPFSMADNQVNVVNVMGDKGIMLPAGHYEQDMERCLDSILENLKRLAGDAVLRKQISKNESKLVDGKGAGRIADALIKLDRKKISG